MRPRFELLHRFHMLSATDGSVRECLAYARSVAHQHYRPPIAEAMPGFLQVRLAQYSGVGVIL